MSREQLKSLIKQKDISIAQLARYADINQQIVYNYFNGRAVDGVWKKVSISADRYEKLVKILKALPTKI